MAAVIAVAVVVAWTVSSTGSVDPRRWWRAASDAVHQVVRPVTQPSPDGRPPGTGLSPMGSKGGEGQSEAVSTRPSSPPTPVTPGGSRDSKPAVEVTVRDGPGAGDTRPGIHVSNDPRGAGGMSGQVGEGPVHAGGTIDGQGVRGCAGVYDATSGQNTCGAVNLPVELPVPPLPAPVVPDVAPSPSP